VIVPLVRRGLFVVKTFSRLRICALEYLMALGDASGNVSLRRMVGLGWFRLRCGEDGAGLVEVAAFVGGDCVEASGEGEAQEFDEGILESDGGEVEVGVGAEEIVGGGVGGEERDGDIG
jgi:hypothetical protein